LGEHKTLKKGKTHWRAGGSQKNTSHQLERMGQEKRVPGWSSKPISVLPPNGGGQQGITFGGDSGKGQKSEGETDVRQKAGPRKKQKKYTKN